MNSQEPEERESYWSRVRTTLSECAGVRHGERGGDGGEEPFLEGRQNRVLARPSVILVPWVCSEALGWLRKRSPIDVEGLRLRWWLLQW